MGKVVPLRRDRSIKRVVKYKKTVDYAALVAMVLIVSFGLLMVYSSSYYASEFRATSSGDPSHFFLKQLLCVAIGGVMMAVMMFFDYHNFIEFPYKRGETGKKGVPLYWIVLIAAVLTLFLVWVPGIGEEANGSRRWINVGISIQPSEIVKAGIIIFMSCSISVAPRKMQSFKSGMAPYLLMLLLVCGCIYFQPNFSAIVCIVLLVMSMLLVGGARLSHIVATAVTGVVLLLILVSLKTYRQDRLEAISDPMSDWQLKQSLFAIGSGGLFGRGLGNSMQKMLYLPYSESDFIFAIVAEELGFVGALGLLLLYGFLIWRGVVIALRAPDLTGMLLCTGVVAIVTIQVVINVGVTIGLIPPTGVVLPFISYGGSSVIIFMTLMGIVLNVSRQCAKRVPVPEHGSIPEPPASREAQRPAREEWDV